MIWVASRCGGVGARRRPPVGAVLLASALGLALALASPAAAAPHRVASTVGCQAVAGGSVDDGGGPHHATVVVDTGSGPVWSACVSFSGTISGVEALERAKDVITDLDPVYDQYTGLGRAVCRLRGVGSDPPDCLGKAPSYWSYSQGGRVMPVGAGATTVGDGGVEGWRYGSGGTPRTATAGTRAATAPATTTTRPTATTQPSTPTTVPAHGGLSGSTAAGGAPAPSRPAPASDHGATTSITPSTPSTTTRPGASSTTVASAGRPAVSDEVDGSGVGDAGADGGTGESAAAASGSAGAGGDDGGSGGSGSVPSVIGFAAVIAAIAGGSVLVRRRRLAAHRPAPTA